MRAFFLLYFTGKGTFAVLFKGKFTGNVFVVKKLHPFLSEDVVKIFAKEAKFLYHINHPNVMSFIRSMQKAHDTNDGLFGVLVGSFW